MRKGEKVSGIKEQLHRDVGVWLRREGTGRIDGLDGQWQVDRAIEVGEVGEGEEGEV